MTIPAVISEEQARGGVTASASKPALSAWHLPIILLMALFILVSLSWALKDDDPRDLGSFWASGAAANRGDDPYAVYPETFRVDGTDATASPNFNPPISLFAFRPLASLSLQSALTFWRVTTLVLYALTVLWLLRSVRETRPLVVLWVFSLAGFWHVLELGQIYVPLLLLTVASWQSLKHERPMLAALPLGLLIAIKPNLMLWPLLLFVGGRRDTPLAALSVCGGASLIALAAMGTAVYEQWLAVTPSLADAGGWLAQIGGNLSLIAVAGRFGVWQAGAVLTMFMVLGCLYLTSTRRPPGAEVHALGISAALLMGPISWVGYTILLLPVLVSRPWNKVMVIAAALLTWPFWLSMIVRHAGIAPAFLTESVYGFAVVLIFLHSCRRILDQPRSKPLRSVLLPAA